MSGGQTIAKSGATGMVSGAHLHFVVKKNGKDVYKRQGLMTEIIGVIL